jgi:Flp pilus assembly protein TadG
MWNQKAGFKTHRKGERGSILAISGIGMLALLLAVGLGVDISRFYLAKTELQNSADAAALAGVSALNSSANGIHEAVNRAVTTMNSYDFNKTGVSFPRANVKFSKNLDGLYVSEGLAAADPKLIRFVEVTTPALPVGVSFAATVLGNSKDMSATATAGYSFPLNTVCNWFPAFVLDLPDAPISKGNDYIFRMEPGGHVSPGNYQLLSPADPGGADTRTGMANGVDVCSKVGDIVPTKPGVTAGDVRQGINSRFDIYQSTLDPATSPPDKNIATGISWADYRDQVVVQPPRHDGVDGRRIIIMPIVKALPDGGRDEVQIDRFGKFWLKEPVGGGNGAELIAYYIDNTILPGRGTFDPSGGPFDPDLAVPVLYK